MGKISKVDNVDAWYMETRLVGIPSKIYGTIQRELCN